MEVILTMSSIQVLLIEDEILLQQFAAAALKARGVRVFSASNTTEADEVLKHEKIDVIVCDILMPMEDGLSYLLRLRESGQRIPVILLSALSEPAVVQRGMQSGAADYMM